MTAELPRPHTCPGPDCRESVPWHMLACRDHWRQVDVSTRARLMDAWQGGQGAGTEAHTALMAAAVAQMVPRVRKIGGRR